MLTSNASLGSSDPTLESSGVRGGSRVTPVQCRPHVMARNHVEDAIGFLAVARDEVHPVALHDHRHDQQHFHHRHVDARAQARPAAEGEVGMPRPTFRSRRQEALGVEGFRVVPELWVAMGEIGAQEDCRSCRNPEPADLIVIASRGMTHTGG